MECIVYHRLASQLRLYGMTHLGGESLTQEHVKTVLALVGFELTIIGTPLTLLY
jgi:hypothetical protein